MKIAAVWLLRGGWPTWVWKYSFPRRSSLVSSCGCLLLGAWRRVRGRTSRGGRIWHLTLGLRGLRIKWNLARLGTRGSQLSWDWPGRQGGSLWINATINQTRHFIGMSYASLRRKILSIHRQYCDLQNGRESRYLCKSSRRACIPSSYDHVVSEGFPWRLSKLCKSLRIPVNPFSICLPNPLGIALLPLNRLCFAPSCPRQQDLQDIVQT